MAFEQREGSGAIFQNSRKKKDSHPDYQGEAKVNGVTLELSGWLKQGKNGEFISLAIKPKGQKRESPPLLGSGSAPRKTDPDDDDREIPF